MRLSILLTYFLGALVSSTHLSIFVPASHALPNPSTLPPSTSATLTTLGHSYVAPLSIDNNFAFRNVSAGSYLLSVSCATHEFAPLRIDVGAPGPGGEAKVEAWGTFRGNEWDNKGEVMPVGGENGVNVLEVRVVGGKEYYVPRSGFSPLSLLKNPMILIGAFSMVVVFGMPYLIENMDPEMKAEYEATQKAGGLSGMVAGQLGQPENANPVANFDAAAWLAGSSKK